jgi:hypothetical protein
MSWLYETHLGNKYEIHQVKQACVQPILYITVFLKAAQRFIVELKVKGSETKASSRPPLHSFSNSNPCPRPVAPNNTYSITICIVRMPKEIGSNTFLSVHTSKSPAALTYRTYSIHLKATRQDVSVSDYNSISLGFPSVAAKAAATLPWVQTCTKPLGPVGLVWLIVMSRHRTSAFSGTDLSPS